MGNQPIDDERLYTGQIFQGYGGIYMLRPGGNGVMCAALRGEPRWLWIKIAPAEEADPAGRQNFRDCKRCWVPRSKVEEEFGSIELMGQGNTDMWF